MKIQTEILLKNSDNAHFLGSLKNNIYDQDKSLIKRIEDKYKLYYIRYKEMPNIIDQVFSNQNPMSLKNEDQ